MTTRLLAAAIAAAPCLACAAAEPLHVPITPNGGFDWNLDGWRTIAPAGGVVEWSPVDANGDAASGSARVAGPAGVYELRTCFDVPYDAAGLRYRVREQVRASGGDARVVTTVVVGFLGDDPEHDAPDCPGPVVDDFRALDAPVAAAAQFTTLESAPRVTYTLPLMLRVFVAKSDAVGVALDDLQIERDVDTLFVDGF
jgi:hypothetical protein